jgi:chemotaxis response regulator CheB
VQNVICCTAMPYTLPRQCGLAPVILVTTEKFKSLPGRNVEHSRAPITPLEKATMSAKKKQAPAATRPSDSGQGKSRRPKANQSADQAEQSLPHVRFPIVGIGASAGGLEAFKRFFRAMPPDSGMAFVLIPHLDPTHGSLMVELLSRQTAMKVSEVEEGSQTAFTSFPPTRTCRLLGDVCN